MNTGFVMLSKDLLEDEMYLSERFTRMQAFFDLCFLASFGSRTFYKRGIKVELQTGQLAKSEEELADRWQWSRNTVRKFLSELQDCGKIEQQKSRLITVISVKNGLIVEQQNEQQIEQQIEQQTIRNNIDSVIDINIDKKKDKKEEDNTELEVAFETFRKKYKQYGGQARGFQTEFDNLKKKHKDWKTIIPLLSFAIDKENAARKNAEIKGAFFPSMKNLQTYINQRSWEAYVDENLKICDNEYRPVTDGVFQYWNEKRQCLMFNGYIDQLNDGYTDDTRPDGAKVAWSMYEWVWSSQTKQWIKQND